MRHLPKPGNALLPTFGFCEVHESAKDIKTAVINEYRFVCEISQHVLYQYVLILLWFAMIFGIVVSVIGLLAKFIGHMITMTCFLNRGPDARFVYFHFYPYSLIYLIFSLGIFTTLLVIAARK